MACKCTNLTSLAGIAVDCNASVGGIKAVYLTPYGDGLYTTSADTVTAFTSGHTWYEYCFRKNTSEYNQTLNVNDNGSRYISHEISLVFPRMEATKRAEMQALTYGDVAAVIQDANGNYWAVPLDEPVSATEGAGATGVQKSDNNQYSITLGAETADYAYQLTDTAITALNGLINGGN